MSIDPSLPPNAIIHDAEGQPLLSGNWLFAQECPFIAGANNIDALPPIGLNEIAVAGRSNVGKSSLLNALTGRNTLARVSHTPGRTQQINFFELGKRLWLVDLPGHGYAQVSKQTIDSWEKLIDYYLKGRPTLRRLLILIDARHGLKESDRNLMDMADKAALSYQIVMTKMDKVTPGAGRTMQAKLAEEVRKRPACHPEIMATSAHDGIGITELRQELASLV